MTTNEKISQMLPRGLRVRRLPVLRLEADRSGVVWERRRGNCARLGACEDEWIAVHGASQAKCPETCSSFQEARS